MRRSANALGNGFNSNVDEFARMVLVGRFRDRVYSVPGRVPGPVE
jgi:hypothetical protein